MYKFRAFKAEQVSKLEAWGTENSKIRNHNGKRWKMTSKEQGVQEEKTQDSRLKSIYLTIIYIFSNYI